MTDFEEIKTLIEKQISHNRTESQRLTAEGLNQTLRRLRKAETESDIAGLLVNTDIAYGRRLACLVFDGEFSRIVSSRGTQTEACTFAIHDSPALVAVIEARDTVVTAATPRELGEALFAATEASALSEPRAYLIPVVVHGAVHGAVRMVLFAAEEVQPAALELLCEATGLRLEAIALHDAVQAKPEPLPQLVQIAGLQAAPLQWAELPQAEQSLHLRAQRFAQVAVAHMRVEHARAVREGRERSDLYSTLRPQIDIARLEYRKQFLAGESKTMVDYLYLELVRSLADDEDRLLGAGFPGRLI